MSKTVLLDKILNDLKGEVVMVIDNLTPWKDYLFFRNNRWEVYNTDFTSADVKMIDIADEGYPTIYLKER